jgi:cell division septum initiation protein DivIVA
MALRPPGETGTADQAPGGHPDVTLHALSLLDTAEQVARRTSEEARQEAQRLIEDAREEAERIRSEARGDAPELQRATEQLRDEQRRTLHDVEELRDQLSSLLGAIEAGSQASDG